MARREEHAAHPLQVLATVPFVALVAALVGPQLVPVLGDRLFGWLPSVWDALPRLPVLVELPEITLPFSVSPHLFFGAVGGAIPAVLGVRMARQFALDRRASATSKLPTVAPDGSVIMRSAARASYARGTVAARGRR
jgi:hypothetical protein